MTTVDKEKEHVIAVLAPRQKTKYRTIMLQMIRSIGIVEMHSDDPKSHFVFIHDGVTSGSTGYVVETVNKIKTSAEQFDPPRTITYRKLPLDIEMHGKRSHFHWIDEVIKLNPDLLLVFDNGSNPALIDYARRQARIANVECDIHRTSNE